MNHEIVVRPAIEDDAPRLGLITVAASLHAFIGAIPEDAIDFDWTPEASGDRWRSTLTSGSDERDVVLVADRAGVVDGFVWAGHEARADGFTGAVRGLYVAPSAHGCGIGRRLFVEAIRQLAAAGSRSVLVGCVRENPACGFYEHLGGIEVFRASRTVDRFETQEIFYGWRSTAELIGVNRSSGR